MQTQSTPLEACIPNVYELQLPAPDYHATLINTPILLHRDF
ncbi:hypothetical protein RSAG8_03261, partial [Rhizoctonia solani AG-8 WAC10335]